MQKYPVRASHRGNLDPSALDRIVRTHFEHAEVAGGMTSASWGALARLSVRANGRELEVDVVMNPTVPDEVARETIVRYNRFLEETTGYTAKERARRLRKSAVGPPSGE